MVSLIYSMMNIPKMRDKRRLVEIVHASHADIKKPPMTASQKGSDINERYPSWNAVKMVTIMKRKIRRRFLNLSLKFHPLLTAFFSSIASPCLHLYQSHPCKSVSPHINFIFHPATTFCQAKPG